MTTVKTTETSESRTWVAFPLIFALLAAGIGFLALLGWVLGLPLLAGFAEDLMPMAPSTAVLFLLFGVAIGLRARTLLNRRSFWISVAAGCLGAMVALLLFVLSCLNVHWAVENLGLNVTGTVGGAPIGHMSPVTAFCFLLVSASFLASLSQSAIRRWRTALALGSAGVLLGTCSILLLAYLYGTPLLYGGTFIPPALNTILAFMLLGLALLISAFQSLGPQGGSSRDIPVASYVLLLVFVLVAEGIVAVGWFYYRSYERHYRAQEERQLAAIAELKVSELTQWRKERLADGATFFKNPSFAALVRRFLAQPADTDTRRQLLDWLGKYPTFNDYDQFRLMDAQGVTRLSLPGGLNPASSETLRMVSEVLRSGQMALQDFYRHERDQRIYLQLMVPILDELDPSRPLGVVELRLDPAIYLYPLLKRWPTPSRTAETVLVRREGNEVIFLNEPMYQTNAALTLRVSLATTDFSVVKAVLGQEGIVESLDYCGCLTVAHVCAVPDSPWFLVARIDAEEIYAPLRERLWLTVLLASGLILSAGAGAGLVWRQQRVRHYREQYEVAEALRNSGALYESLVENLPAAVLRKDLAGRYTFVNARFCELVGKPAAEVLGRTDSDLTPGDLARKYCADDQRVIETGRLLECIEEHTRVTDGSRRWLQTLKSPVRDAAGRIIGTQAVLLDISERKRSIESQARLATAVEQAAESIVITDAAGAIVYVNPAFEKVTGYTRQEVAGQNPRILKGGKADTAFYRQMWETLARGEVWTGHFINRRKDGTLYEEEATISPIRDAAGKVINYVAVKRDVTRETQLESQLRQAQKMEAVGRLAGGVAHDFNNLLTVMRGRTEMVLSQLQPGSGNAEDLREVLHAVERAANLTRQLLAFSRQQPLQVQPLDLNAVVNDMTKMLRRIVGEDIKVCVRYAPALPAVSADVGMMEQVILNLAVNARDAMPKGGQLTLETAAEQIDAEYVQLHAEASAGSHVCLSVSDTGCGIPAGVLPRIFEPFFTTKEVGKGTGLGLATVHGIVKQHNGWINVYSEVNHGTVFRIYLPAAKTAAGVAAVAAPLAQPPRGGTETILIVEDDGAVRTLMRLVLERRGYRILEAGSGVAALELWKEQGDQVDLVLTDMVMPEGMSGWELGEALWADKPELKIIFSSGYSADSVGHEFVAHGKFNFLQKPYDSKKLLEMVRQCLDRQNGSQTGDGPLV